MTNFLSKNPTIGSSSQYKITVCNFASIFLIDLNKVQIAVIIALFQRKICKCLIRSHGLETFTCNDGQNSNHLSYKFLNFRIFIAFFSLIPSKTFGPALAKKVLVICESKR